jgi:hypothetical protein
MATYIVTHIEGDTDGRRDPQARRFKTRSEADALLEHERAQGKFAILYKEDYERSGEVTRVNDPGAG